MSMPAPIANLFCKAKSAGVVIATVSAVPPQGCYRHLMMNMGIFPIPKTGCLTEYIRLRIVPGLGDLLKPLAMFSTMESAMYMRPAHGGQVGGLGTSVLGSLAFEPPHAKILYIHTPE